MEIGSWPVDECAGARFLIDLSGSVADASGNNVGNGICNREQEQQSTRGPEQLAAGLGLASDEG